MKRLCATVLIMEAIVITLAVPVAVQIGHMSSRHAWLAAGVAVGAAVLFAALARLVLPVTIVAGTLLQIFVIVTGVVVPVMYFLGGIFAALWAIGIWLGYHVEHATGQ
jgi:Protein of unknown function (DUF4233)